MNKNLEPPASTRPKIAIVHDWLYGGGAERVVYELHALYPNAPIYTAYCSDEWRTKLDGKVITGYLQHLGRIRKFLPLLQYWWFKRLYLNGYDIIISSSGNGMAKSITKPANAVHINYCHTPVHYLWRHYTEYIQRPGFGIFNGIARIGLKLLLKPLQKRDFAAAQKVDYFIANSTHIQNDIKRFYKRESTVIFPPVDTERFHKTPAARHGFITVGRLAPMKRVDLIIEACNMLGEPLTVVGRGPEIAHLQSIAGPTITFVTNASDKDVARFMNGANAFLFASFEDFGITPVEALAAGTPVIAYDKGGALDYITKDTGVLFNAQSAQALIRGIKEYKTKPWNSKNISLYAQNFSVATFRKHIQEYITNALKNI